MERVYALLIGYVLDLCLGDPLWMPHPVVAVGKCISLLERMLRRIFPAGRRGEFLGGLMLVCIVVALSFAVVYALLYAVGLWLPEWRMVAEGFICYQLLATKCLKDAGGLVWRELSKGDLPAAREAVGRIVGRDTAGLDESGVARAAVETVAENSSDGVIAPMFYFIIGGAPLAMAYKAINTMDSMLGYKNERNLYFGRAAALLDDAANFLPARITGVLLAAAALCGYDRRGAWRIFLRDRKNHTSPNSAHPEAACAGALGIRLGGDSTYGGRVVSKPGIGDANRELEAEDIRRASRLLYVASFLGVAVCCTGFWLATAVWNGMETWN